jgi:hypothetical protein
MSLIGRCRAAEPGLWFGLFLAGTPRTRAISLGDAQTRHHGRSWSASSCCSRPRWSGCATHGRPGWSGGPRLHRSPQRRLVTPFEPGAAWATQDEHYGFTKQPR